MRAGGPDETDKGTNDRRASVLRERHSSSCVWRNQGSGAARRLPFDEPSANFSLNRRLQLCDAVRRANQEWSVAATGGGTAKCVECWRSEIGPAIRTLPPISGT